MQLKDRFEIVRPLEQMELELVRATLENPRLADAHEEATLRTALCLARMYKVRDGAKELGVGALLTPFREELVQRLRPVLLPSRGPLQREALMPHLREMKERTQQTYDALLLRFRDKLSPQAIDRELRHKALVLVSGGGGGTGYVYLGAMGLLDEYGLKPELMVGTSIGAILSLFRARMPRFDETEIVSIIRSLSWKRLFRIISMENRYGLPAAMRLFLRSGIGRWFGVDHPDQPGGLRLSQLPIRTMVAVSGIRTGKLPHPLAFYERLLSVSPRAFLHPLGLVKSVQSSFSVLAELFNRPDILTKIHLGADELTREFDALDAVGFSSALPGIIHYDVLRDDPRMHGLIGAVMEQHGVSRFIDGGLADNLPCKAAWRAVHKGELGTRNAFILALNGFAMKTTTPLWLPLQRLAEINVSKNRPYAHQVIDFRRTLSAIDLVPGIKLVMRALELGRAQMTPKMPLVARMLAPLPRVLVTR